MLATLSWPISVQFLILMSIQKVTYTNNMSCCLHNLMSTHKSSATAVLLQWTSDTNRTTCAQTHNSDCTVSGANAVCYALLQWFRDQVWNLVCVQLCQRGFKCSDITATKNLGLLWGGGEYGTIITICENKLGLYKTIKKLWNFVFSDIQISSLLHEPR